MGIQKFKKIICISLLAGSSTLLVSCGNALTDWIFPIKGKGLEGLVKEIPPIKPKVIEPFVEICNTDPESEVDNILVTFALDTTGSNSDAQVGPGQGTDNNRANRYGNLLTWINNRKNSGIDISHEKYALIEFAEQGQGIRINAKQGAVFGEENNSYYMTLDEFETMIQQQRSKTAEDVGGTPYQDTLQTMEDVLTQEIERVIQKYNQEKEINHDLKIATFQSLNIFLSDGSPFTGKDGCDVEQNPNNQGCLNFGPVKENAILAKVTELVDILPNQEPYSKFIKNISLNTGFYEIKDNPTAKTRLSGMALKGHGKFFDFSLGKEIDYNQVVVVETRYVPREILDWEIKNLNAQWDEDVGKLLLDSDADGVADVYEYPHECVNQYSCNKSGIRDGVYFKISGKKKSCPTEIGPDNIEVCRSEPANTCLKNAQGKMIDQDGDTLTQCEEAKLGSSDLEYDTNKDLIVDDTAFYRNYFITSQNGISGQAPVGDYDGDGLNDYQELTKTFTPRTWHNTNDIPGVKAVERVRLSTTFDSVKNKKCDYYVIKNMPVMKADKSDLIQITIVDWLTFGTGEKSLRIAKVPLKNGAVDIRDKDFKSYIVK